MNIYQRDHTQKPELFQLITEHKNDVVIKHCRKYRDDIQLKGWMDDTPLHVASSSGNFEIAQWLIRNGANVNSPRTGVFQMPVCWASTVEIAELLLKNGATLNGEELIMATSQDRVAVVDVLLKHNAPLILEKPQYLNAHSKEMLDAYRQNSIDIGKPDEHESNLLHTCAWSNNPALFDYAYGLGVEWRKDSSHRTPYGLAKQGRRTTFIQHLKENYPQLVNYSATERAIGAYDVERVLWLRRVSRHKDLFVALTSDGELLQFELNDEQLVMTKRVAFNVNFIRNFAIDQAGNLILPTGDDELLLIGPHSLEINQRIQLEPDSDFHQITYLPLHEIFLATGRDWSVYILDKAFQQISKESVSDGVFYPIIGKSEELLSLYSYDQETYHKLYSMDAQHRLEPVHTFDDSANTTGYDIAIDGNEVFIITAPFLRAYRFVNGVLEQKWETMFEDIPEKTRYDAVALLSSHVLALGFGHDVYLVSRSSGVMISQPKVRLSGIIQELIADASTGKLIIRTDKEIHVAGIGQLPQ